MNRTDKAAKLEELKDKFSRAQSVVLVDFSGINVEQITEVRAKLREKDVEYQVVKNTLARQAMEGTSVSVLEEHFSGPTGMAISYDDAAAPAKVLNDAAKDLEALTFKGAMVEGEAFGADAISDLAKMPSKDDIRATFVATLQAPLANFAGVINAPQRDFTWLMDALRRKKEESGE